VAVPVEIDPAKLLLLFIHANARATVARGTPAVNEVHRLSVTGTPVAGDVRIGYAAGNTGPINWNAAAADAQTAYEAAPWTGGAGNISATGGPWPAPIDVEFVGGLAGANVADPSGTNVYSMAWTGGALVSATVLQSASAGSTDDLMPLEPNWPLAWHPGSVYPCPLTATATTLTFANLSATRRTLVRFRAVLAR
jgi:hypothetical protein